MGVKTGAGFTGVTTEVKTSGLRTGPDQMLTILFDVNDLFIGVIARLNRILGSFGMVLRLILDQVSLRSLQESILKQIVI